MRAATVAIIIREAGGQPHLIEILSDDREIEVFERAYLEKDSDPLKAVYEYRSRLSHEEDQFGEYVENLLTKPFLRPEIQNHGLQWFRSKLKIEQYQKSEGEAAKIIADYALHVYQQDPSRDDFSIAGPSSKVRIRVFLLNRDSSTQVA